MQIIITDVDRKWLPRASTRPTHWLIDRKIAYKLSGIPRSDLVTLLPDTFEPRYRPLIVSGAHVNVWLATHCPAFEYEFCQTLFLQHAYSVRVRQQNGRWKTYRAHQFIERESLRERGVSA